ncbi:uncharacterized protein V6R79_020516 [Siganus canaliculatus]
MFCQKRIHSAGNSVWFDNRKLLQHQILHSRIHHLVLPYSTDGLNEQLPFAATNPSLPQPQMPATFHLGCIDLYQSAALNPTVELSQWREAKRHPQVLKVIVTPVLPLAKIPGALHSPVCKAPKLQTIFHLPRLSNATVAEETVLCVSAHNATPSQHLSLTPTVCGVIYSVLISSSASHSSSFLLQTETGQFELFADSRSLVCAVGEQTLQSALVCEFGLHLNEGDIDESQKVKRFKMLTTVFRAAPQGARKPLSELVDAGSLQLLQSAALAVSHRL